MTPKLLHGRDSSGKDDREAVARADRAVALVDALCTVLETTDRIMTGSRTLAVRVNYTPNAYPAWTDGETIFLNEQLIHALFLDGGDMATAVRVVKGTNYHERAHVMFTPRRGTPFNTRLLEWAGYDYVKLMLYNSLEDQRIETLYTNAFSSTRHYFIAAAMQWLVRDLSEAAITLSYPLLRGRRYLPAIVRAKARAAFTRYFPERLVEQFEAELDLYIQTAPEADPETSVRCVARIYDLLLRTRPRVPTAVPLYEVFDSATHCRVALEKGEIDAAAEAGAIRDVSGMLGSDDLEWRDFFAGAKSGGRRGAGEGDDEAPLSADDLLDAARDALRDALRSAQIASEVNRTQTALQAAMDRLTDSDDESVGPAGARNRSVPPRFIGCSNRLAQNLRRIHDELEPALVHDLPAGRLNAFRSIRHAADRERFEIFDRFEPGFEEEAEMEVVILIDISMSMRPQINEAAAAMWILKRALDSIEVRATVYGFGTTAYLLYGPNQRVKRREMLAFPADDGATRPYEAVRLAFRTIRRSECANKMLVVITDGRWGGHEPASATACDYMIAAMRESGTRTVLFTLGGALKRGGGHNCEFVYEISSPEQVVDIVEEIVAKVLAGAVS